MLQVDPSIVVRACIKISILFVLDLLFHKSYYSYTALVFFLYLNVFMHYIHSYFRSIYMSHLIMPCTCLCVLYITHKFLICFINTCIHLFILSFPQIIYQLYNIVHLFYFCISPHISITQHYILKYRPIVKSWHWLLVLAMPYLQILWGKSNSHFYLFFYHPKIKIVNQLNQRLCNLFIFFLTLLLVKDLTSQQVLNLANTICIAWE